MLDKFMERMSNPKSVVNEPTTTLGKAIAVEKAKVAALQKKIEQKNQALAAMQSQISMLKQQLAVVQAKAATKVAKQAPTATAKPPAPSTKITITPPSAKAPAEPKAAPAESFTMAILRKMFGVA